MTKNAWSDGDSVTATQLNRMEDQLVITCTNATRPTGVEGQHIWETDTNREYVYDGSAWRALYSPWTTYTPSWTNLTLGNGTQSARYMYVPGAIRMVGDIVFGSTSSISGGTVLQAVADSRTALVSAVGSFHLDDSTGTTYSGSIRVLTSGTSVAFFGDSGGWTSTNPFTAATGDRFTWDITVPI